MTTEQATILLRAIVAEKEERKMRKRLVIVTILAWLVIGGTVCAVLEATR